MWAQGLGANPAVPDDLRRALLGRSRHLLWRKRPSSVLRHPGLPVPVLVRLLRDPATAEEAAGHPALPVDVMWRMIQQP
ncbi:hypothetical protein SBI_04379 [Streptomyces bingchenggensis BCW-1]|uniref:Uncharacterized protein n=2 Tax=Streptomyces TaxID=1883 RepID=D7BTR0_STRBB|nr:hypothetical protein SBI_04379 [Streptomyces bingchenggensis BCW-1]